MTHAELAKLIEAARSQPMTVQMDTPVIELANALEKTMLAYLALQRVAEIGRPLVPNKLNGQVVGWWFAGHTAETPAQAILGATDGA